MPARISWAKPLTVTLAIVFAIGATGTAQAATTAFVVSGTTAFDFDSSQTGPSTAALDPLINSNFYDFADATVSVINYPRSAFPLTGFQDPTLGFSVTAGTTNLDEAIHNATGPIVVTGLSQGAVVLDREQRLLKTDPDAPSPADLTFIVAGDLTRKTPLTTGLWTYFPQIYVPILDYTNYRPVESQYNTIVVVGEYDGWADFPDRPWNLLADLNALVGAFTVHPLSGFADPAQVPTQNIVTTTNSLGATTTTYLVPTAQLPLLDPLTQIGVPQPIIDALNAVLKPLVDAGYSRNDTGLAKLMPYVETTAGLPVLALPILKNTSEEPTESASTAEAEDASLNSAPSSQQAARTDHRPDASVGTQTAAPSKVRDAPRLVTAPVQSPASTAFPVKTATPVDTHLANRGARTTSSVSAKQSDETGSTGAAQTDAERDATPSSHRPLAKSTPQIATSAQHQQADTTASAKKSRANASKDCAGAAN